MQASAGYPREGRIVRVEARQLLPEVSDLLHLGEAFFIDFSQLRFEPPGFAEPAVAGEGRGKQHAGNEGEADREPGLAKALQHDGHASVYPLTQSEANTDSRPGTNSRGRLLSGAKRSSCHRCGEG